MAGGLEEQSQPLLHKISPSIPTTEGEIDSYHCPPFGFNYGPRRVRDLPFLFIFFILVACTFAFGVFCVAHRNPDYRKLGYFAFDNSTSSCVESSTIVDERGTCSWLNAANVVPKLLLEYLVSTLAVTLALSTPLMLVLLRLLRNYAKQAVFLSLPLLVIIPLLVNVFWFITCTLSESCREAFPLALRIFVLVFVFGVVGVILYIILANWRSIDLTSKILGISVHALEENLGLLGVMPSLMFALLVFFAPVIFFMVFARFNGRIVPRSSGSYDEHLCVWKQDRWVPAYYALAIITMIWSMAMMIEAQVYMISGTVAQWYFAKDASMTRRRIRSSVRNAFGPSFGTVCFSGLLICVVRCVQNIIDSARREDATGINLVLQHCIEFLLSAIDFLNKFTIHFVAITGEGYCSASKMTYELLRRNLLSVGFVEVSTHMLLGIMFVISTIYAIMVCAILMTVSKLGTDVYIMAMHAWLLLFVVLSCFVYVLDNVINTIYVCFAIDRDKGEVSKHDVHQVYGLLTLTKRERLLLAGRTSLV
ncbi:CTL-like protein [Nymphaea thermarum]|nr:CTL-like protein [Nymphaea thermarum]